MSTTKNTEGLKYDSATKCFREAMVYYPEKTNQHQGCMGALMQVAAPLERENVALRELVQKLVDAGRLIVDGKEIGMFRMDDAISLAKDQGFEPKY